jgi:hypothetical protein
VQEPRRSLDVREEERDRARRQIGPHSGMMLREVKPRQPLRAQTG